MLWTDALNDVRGLLQDRRGTLRYSDDDIRAAFNHGIRLAYRLRPDLFIIVGEPPIMSPADVTSNIPLPIAESYCDGLVGYAAGWCLLRDDEYTADGRASALTAAFRIALTGASPE